MALIEVLPTTTTTRPSHGWAYVPDTGPIKAILPFSNRNRKRGAPRHSETGIGTGTGTGSGIGGAGTGNRTDVGAKQAKKTERFLAELEKENFKDTVIAVPQREKGKGKGKKITPNVRRILMYQRTFAHYLAEEEALAGQQSGGGASTTAPATPAASLARSNSTRISGRQREQSQLPMHPPPRPRSSDVSATPTPTRTKQAIVSSSPSSRPPHPQSQPPPSALPPTNPLAPLPPSLNPITPKPPSAHLLSALLSEPPLSYTAARAKPVFTGTALAAHPQGSGHGSGSPQGARPAPRYFCAICGYWGKIKCTKCGERTCGLMECWRGHEGVCSGGY